MISINQSISTKLSTYFLIYKQIRISIPTILPLYSKNVQHPSLEFNHKTRTRFLKACHEESKQQSLKKTTNPNYRPRLLHIFSQI